VPEAHRGAAEGTSRALPRESSANRLVVRIDKQFNQQNSDRNKRTKTRPSKICLPAGELALQAWTTEGGYLGSSLRERISGAGSSRRVRAPRLPAAELDL